MLKKITELESENSGHFKAEVKDVEKRSLYGDENEDISYQHVLLILVLK